VSGALPLALRELGHDVKLLIPGYKSVLAKITHINSLGELQVFANIRCELLSAKLPNTELDVIVIRHSGLYERDGSPYVDTEGSDWHDNAMRFGVLSKVASLLSCQRHYLNWLPEVVHCNDWQSGLTPCYMRLCEHSTAKTLFSVHNLAFQGNFPPHWLSPLELPVTAFQMNGLEFYAQLSFMKAGLFYADQLSTVSPTYAKEIQTETFGFGLQGLIQARQHQLTGILNGINTEEWNPATDSHLPYCYTEQTLSNKQGVKQQLQLVSHLPVSNQQPLFGVVSRLTHQKGLDILLEALPELVAMDCQLVVLGSGDKSFEARFLQFSQEYPKHISVTIGYDEPLSHLIMAGADAFIMPSRFEPCGLNQLYALRYGTLPIVSNTGGLADSICHTSDETLRQGVATGFKLASVDKMSLLVTLQQVLSTWQEKTSWQAIQTNGMKQALGWQESAKAYVALYEKTLNA